MRTILFGRHFFIFTIEGNWFIHFSALNTTSFYGLKELLPIYMCAVWVSYVCISFVLLLFFFALRTQLNLFLCFFSFSSSSQHATMRGLSSGILKTASSFLALIIFKGPSKSKAKHSQRQNEALPNSNSRNFEDGAGSTDQPTSCRNCFHLLKKLQFFK